MQRKLSILFMCMSFVQFLFAQGITQTPYSQFGYGDVETLVNARMVGTGGAGLASALPYQINFKNPAMAAYNRQFVIFEGGFYGQNLRLSTANGNQRILNGNIQYLSLLIPLSQKNWTVIAGIAPYSNANTRYRTEAKIDGLISSTNEMVDSGYVFNSRFLEGGLNQVFITNAIKLPKGFSVGLQTSFILGTITRRNNGLLQNIQGGQLEIVNTTTQIKSSEIYRFLEFKPSIGYIRKLNEKNQIGFGATATFNRAMSARRELITNILSRSNGFSIYSDTVSQTKSDAVLPSEYSFGSTFTRFNKFNASIDYTYIDYSRYKSFAPVNIFTTGHKLNAGLEYVPRYDAIRGYLKRIAYRFGGYYYIMPYSINGTSINEYAATFGLGLPVGKSSGIGMLNLAFSLGQRGTTENNLVRENYFRFFVGLNINDKWFRKYKVD